MFAVVALDDAVFAVEVTAVAAVLTWATVLPVEPLPPVNASQMPDRKLPTLETPSMMTLPMEPSTLCGVVDRFVLNVPRFALAVLALVLAVLAVARTTAPRTRTSDEVLPVEPLVPLNPSYRSFHVVCRLVFAVVALDDAVFAVEVTAVAAVLT